MSMTHWSILRREIEHLITMCYHHRYSVTIFFFSISSLSFCFRKSIFIPIPTSGDWPSVIYHQGPANLILYVYLKDSLEKLSDLHRHSDASRKLTLYYSHILFFTTTSMVALSNARVSPLLFSLERRHL
jgi:hypothetical protein